jgi:23S rRNA U2552 (ribose-2'-O)-methylase RlmE/FtsJ
MKKITQAVLILSLLSFPSFAAEDCADRAAIERVYHAHRIATQQTFEQAMPRELIEKLVRQDQHKEAVLHKVYGVDITPAMVAAEVQRIDTTTRAPEVLAEIKHALGDAPARFANAMARPIVVERTLRARFEDDDKLHAPQRHEAEQARESLLAKKPVGGMHDVTWQLTPRPADGNPDLRSPISNLPASSTKGVAKSDAYSVEATVQLAQTLSPPPAERDRKLYFDDVDPELQKVLRVQLQKPGDVSAVIETPGGFLLFLGKERTAEALSAASFSIPKRSYEEWLAHQPEP